MFKKAKTLNKDKLSPSDEMLLIETLDHLNKLTEFDLIHIEKRTGRKFLSDEYLNSDDMPTILLERTAAYPKGFILWVQKPPEKRNDIIRFAYYIPKNDNDLKNRYFYKRCSKLLNESQKTEIDNEGYYREKLRSFIQKKEKSLKSWLKNKKL